MAAADPVVGFIGFGEAGFHIAKGLRAAGLALILAYDIHTHTPGRGELIQRRARESGVSLADSSQLLASACDLLLSTVTASSALEAALQTAPFLDARHLYADLNSVAPATKQAIDAAVCGAGARFVEGAIMSPVPAHGHRAPILLGGGAATEFAQAMGRWGMRLEVLGTSVGGAAAVKMFRSIVVKGLEALLFECVLGASRYGAEKRVFDSLGESFPGLDWDKLANYMVGRVVVHGERRAREMEEVAATLRSLDIEPIMADATARRQDWGARLELWSRFAAEGPAGYAEVLRVLERRASASGG
jgi:3-hydroxyisobutyrate dehydrogenase-like beta-hydroxyacid dehydrogenase